MGVNIDAIAELWNQVYIHQFMKVIKTDNRVSEFEMFALFKKQNKKIIFCP